MSRRGDGGLSHGVLLGVSTGCQRAVEGRGAGRPQQRPRAWPGLLSPLPRQRGDTLASFYRQDTNMPGHLASLSL